MVTLIHILLGFLAPLVIIGTCAHLIRTRLRQEGCAHARRLKRLLLVLVSTFFAFWFPFNTVLVARLWQWQARYRVAAHPLSYLLRFNSCLNPFLYVFIGQRFPREKFSSLYLLSRPGIWRGGFSNQPVPR